jgi:trimeric autotransporter adhesin
MKAKIRNSISSFVLIPLVLACFALLPSVQAAPDPAPPPGANTRDGAGAMASITTGNNNSAFGTNALNKNTVGQNNAAQGNSALFSNVSGSGNVAIGNTALRFSNSNQNVAVGSTALNANISGGGNVAVGYGALRNATSGFNVAIGHLAGNSVTTASNMIAIGVPGAGPFANISNTCFIGAIYNQPVSNGATFQDIGVDQYNVLGFNPSSRRFKHDIQAMDKASETLYGLKPVTFKYKSDEKGRTQYGLIAEDVAEVAPDLVFRDNNGEIATVRFEQVGAMLLNEFLKEHRTVQEQQKEIDALKAELKEQKALIQKVSDKVELSRPAPQVAENNQ